MIRLLTVLLQVGIFIVSILLVVNTLIVMGQPFKPKIDYAELKDSQIAYYTRGKGEPLLLIEGFGMTMEDWDPIFIRELAKKRHVIVFDLRQAGLSKGDLTDFSVHQAIEDTIGLMDHLRIQKADIFGWSMGSLIAQEMALSHEERVRNIILASTLSADSHSLYMTEELGKELESTVLGSWEEFSLFMFPQDSEGQSEAYSYLERIEKAVKNGESPRTPHVDMMVKTKQQEAVEKLSQRGNRLEQLASIKKPVLVIAGEEDILIPPQNNEIVAKAIPRAELTLFPGGGHAFLFSDAVTVAQRINQFLQ